MATTFETASVATASIATATIIKKDNDQIDYTKYIEEPWSIINSHFRGKHLRQLVSHQIESYNDFVNYQIQKTISMFNPVHICSEEDFVKEVGKYRLEMFITF